MILYSNSCSFGAPAQGHIIYPEIVANSLSATLVNDGLKSSCNRRIIRSSLRSLINLKKQHNKIIALIGLTFISRTELWQPVLGANGVDGDFHSIQSDAINQLDWSEGLINNIKNVYDYADNDVKEYYKQWLLHMSKEAEVTNLLADVIMLSNYAKSNNIKMVIFCNTQKLPTLPEVDNTSPFLQDFVAYIKNDNSIINLWDFSFADYALSLDYIPKDFNLYGLNGHPGDQAHHAFGNYLLKNYV